MCSEKVSKVCYHSTFIQLIVITDKPVQSPDHHSHGEYNDHGDDNHDCGGDGDDGLNFNNADGGGLDFGNGNGGGLNFGNRGVIGEVYIYLVGPGQPEKLLCGA